MSVDSAQASAASSTANGTSGPAKASMMSKEKRFHLADALRDCAVLVEENGFDEAIFVKVVRDLTNYVETHERVQNSKNPAPTPPAPKPVQAQPVKAQPVPPSRASPPTVTAIPVKPSSTYKQQEHARPNLQRQPSNSDSSAISNQKNYNFLGKISKTINEFGHDLTDIAHRSGFEKIHDKKQATSSKNAQRVKSDLEADLRGRPQRTGGAAASERNTKTDTGYDNPKRPPFQRPVNPNSTLIANGWIEQQRRSKMRTVWKEVLVSLVAGRRPGEETTLWVQRETTNVNGGIELEALHQIPIKGMQDVHYVDFFSDHRFVIQVYNLSDEFIFRAPQSSAAKNWVSTLRLTREAIINGVPPPRANDLQAQQQHQQPPQQQQQRPKQPHFATAPGVSTSYSGEDEKKADPSPTGGNPPQRKRSVGELRAIAHGAGVNTHGMERGELEAIVQRIQRAAPPPPGGPPPPANTGPPFAPHPPPGPPPSDVHAPEDELLQHEREQRAQKAAAEAEEATRRARDEEAAARRAAEERSRAEAEHLRAQADEEKRRRAAAEQQAEAERRKQHEEHLRQQQAQQQWQQQQWQKQQEEQRRRAAAEAEQRRRHEEYLRQQQWQQQQQWQHQQQQARPPPGGYPQQHPQYPQGHGAPPQQQRPGPPPPQPGAAPGASQVNQKYAKMAEEDVSASTITAIKHNILIQWALMPPTLQMLRPIEDLITTIHKVFPPVSGVPAHDYFKKWKSLSKADLMDGHRVDEDKLKKAVRKLRFFLHPDKLGPQNLSEEQTFVCKMLWDITNDANEEYFKKQEDLDWIK